ncbi:MAG: hypothetical protein JST32_18970, partial [Bacteroidetes bacterium]|nr:hypothetical protein [Bacteroidota bacterium]
MRILVPTLLLVFLWHSVFGSSKTDSILTQLKTEITRGKFYDNQKEAFIRGLKIKLEATPQSNADIRYH